MTEYKLHTEEMSLACFDVVSRAMCAMHGRKSARENGYVVGIRPTSTFCLSSLNAFSQFRFQKVLV